MRLFNEWNTSLPSKVYMMRGYKFSWCILILDDTPLCCPITHVDCAMQQGHSVKWDRSVSTLRMLHRMQYSIAFWKCPEYRCLASKVLVWSLTVVSYNPINNSWTSGSDPSVVWFLTTGGCERVTVSMTKNSGSMRWNDHSAQFHFIWEAFIVRFITCASQHSQILGHCQN